MNVLFSRKDIYHNYDKWSTKDKNVLFVIGHSGSGKSHLSRELSKEKSAIMIEGDAFLFKDADHYNNDTIKCRQLFYQKNPRKRIY